MTETAYSTLATRFLQQAGGTLLWTPVLVPFGFSLWRQLMTLARSQDSQTLTRAPEQEFRWLEAGETGVTFRELFESQLRGTRRVTLVDPHVKTFRQIRLFREFLDGLSEMTPGPISVNLVTSEANAAEGWAYGQAEALSQLQDDVGSNGIDLRVQFDEKNHDRWIQTDDWTILLGKGLDIWDSHQCRMLPQQARTVAKKVAIVYIPRS